MWCPSCLSRRLYHSLLTLILVMVGCIDKSSRDVSTTATVDAKIVFAHAFTTTRKDLPLSLLSHQLRCGDVDFTNRQISYQSSTRLMANSSSLDEGTSSTKYHLVWSPRFWKKTILGFALWFLLQSVLLKTSISLAAMQPCHTDYTSFARALPSTVILSLLSSSCCAFQLIMNALTGFGCIGFNTYLGTLHYGSS